MKFLIYAAGQNRRFNNTLKGEPKGLQLVAGKPLIEFGLSWMVKYYPTEIIIVVGYKSDLFKKTLGTSFSGIPIKYVFNDKYDLHGNMSSLWVAREHCNDDIIFTVSDLLCDKENIDFFMKSDYSSKILIDKSKSLFSDPDPVKVSISQKGIYRILKKIPENEIDGIAIGIYKLSRDMIQCLINKIEIYYKTDNYDLSLYYAINDLVSEKPIKPVYCQNSNWCDVDTPKELQMLNTTIDNKRFY